MTHRLGLKKHACKAVKNLTSKSFLIVGFAVAGVALIALLAPRSIVAAPNRDAVSAASNPGARHAASSERGIAVASTSPAAEEPAQPSQTKRRTRREGGGRPARDAHGRDHSKRWPGKHRRISDEELERGLAILKTYWPERYEFLVKLRDENPSKFNFAVRAFGHKLKKLVDLARNNPELAKLEIEVAKVEFEMLQAARAYRLKKLAQKRAATEKPDSEGLSQDNEQLLNKLTKLAGRRFDLDVLRAQRRIDHIAEQLRRQRERLEQRRAKKSEEVRRTVKRMLTEPFPRRGLSDELIQDSPRDDRPPRRKWMGPGGKRRPDISTGRQGGSRPGKQTAPPKPE